MQPTNNIGFLIQHLAASLARQSDQVLQERLDIGFSQFKILMVLQRKPYAQQRHIADVLGQTQASISRQIKLLDDMGLVQTTVSPQNRREHITTLTTKGIRYSETAIEILNSYHQPMFEELSADQQEQLSAILQTMHDYACQPGKNGACHQINGK